MYRSRPRVGGLTATVLGYVQGMSDLCAPVYVVTDADEELTFWCFVSVMDRMVRNFSSPLPKFRNTNGTPLSL